MLKKSPEEIEIDLSPDAFAKRYAEEAEKLGDELYEHAISVLGENSLSQEEIAELVVNGGLLEAQGDSFVEFLKERHGYDEERIEKCREVYEKLDEKYSYIKPSSLRRVLLVSGFATYLGQLTPEDCLMLETLARGN